MVDKIISFVTMPRIRRNQTMVSGTLEYYIRISKRHLDGHMYSTLDLARLENTDPGKGRFKAVLLELERRLPTESSVSMIYVECVHNERLQSFLLRNGYTRQKSLGEFFDHNYYKLFSAVTV